MTVCVIPARGGSKRIPRKNIREFLGKPMIAWSISAAKEAGCFERVVVSTDDDEIAEIASAVGAEVPFRRDPSLSDDTTTTAPVIADAVSRLGVMPGEPICCLYATAPFVRADDLVEGLEILEGQQARFVVSVTSYAFPIQRALRRFGDGRIEMIEPANMLTRSQDLEEAWHDAGQFYWARASEWSKPGLGIFAPGAHGMTLPRYRVQDIDTEEDWVRAEFLMSALLQQATFHD
ncbi:pseudaminic acid cytidylyltransferase [Qipengyuania gaetbuli]|uniref:pseudaminic acid cytidylyltransferase n=1 Tax=Qipengyuania gaetbuli TaxID=266952 RepID=UPI001CFF3405|nr:pseudaminic acid cytidylyltransferase [Qipengyuania gaetbuli]